MILLSFDIEEFDVPIEYGHVISIDEQIQISKQGTLIILNLLREFNVKATFFCTVFFAENATDVIQQIILDGHEVASHGLSHSKFNIEDLEVSKIKLESICNTPIKGFRMARMSTISNKAIYAAGYNYNSSLNPTFIPGRYNYLFKPRKWYIEDNVFQIPASVTPYLRIPLFWMTFHNLPLRLYLTLLKSTLMQDKYINIYFHPWEFIDISNSRYGLPFLILEKIVENLWQKGFEYY